MKKTIIIMLVIMLFTIPFVIAPGSLGTFKQFSEPNLKIPCSNPEQFLCRSNVNCNLTMVSPESDFVVNNEPMTYNITVYTLDLNSAQTSMYGLYAALMTCDNGTNSGIDRFTMSITASGLENRQFDNMTLAIGIVMLLSMFLIWVGIRTEDPWPVVISGFLMVAVGVYTNLFGIAGLNDQLSQYFSLILIGIGVLVTFRGLEATGFGENFPRLGDKEE